MTTLSAGAVAGLLVALMVIATGDSRGAELAPETKLDNAVARPASTRTVYQLRAPRGIGKVDAESVYAARA